MATCAITFRWRRRNLPCIPICISVSMSLRDGATVRRRMIAVEHAYLTKSHAFDVSSLFSEGGAARKPCTGDFNHSEAQRCKSFQMTQSSKHFHAALDPGETRTAA